MSNPVFCELDDITESLKRRNSYQRALEGGNIVENGEVADSSKNKVSSSGKGSSSTHRDQKKQTAINFFKALLIPGVIVYSLSYACLKLVSYSLLFWLPYYLNQRESYGLALNNVQIRYGSMPY
jgi:hypothetical protein